MFLRKNKLSYLELFYRTTATRMKRPILGDKKQGTTVVKVANAVVMGVFTMLKKRMKKTVLL